MVRFVLVPVAIRVAAFLAAPRERSEGSNLGKPIIDWSRAFEFYLDLSDERRSYQAVAEEFGVSVRTVETHGREERWGERLREIKRKAAEEARDRYEQAHVKRLIGRLRLVEATFGSYADQLTRGDVRVTPADLERLHRLSRQFGEELHLAAGGNAETPVTTSTDRSPEHTAAVIKALTETGALEALGLHFVGEGPTAGSGGHEPALLDGSVINSGGAAEAKPPPEQDTFFSPYPGREEHR